VKNFQLVDYVKLISSSDTKSITFFMRTRLLTIVGLR